jgi:hypothetical protein
MYKEANKQEQKSREENIRKRRSIPSPNHLEVG